MSLRSTVLCIFIQSLKRFLNFLYQDASFHSSHPRHYWRSICIPNSSQPPSHLQQTQGTFFFPFTLPSPNTQLRTPPSPVHARKLSKAVLPTGETAKSGPTAATSTAPSSCIARPTAANMTTWTLTVTARTDLEEHAPMILPAREKPLSKTLLRAMGLVIWTQTFILMLCLEMRTRVQASILRVMG